ncbi:hypothetical protein QJS10_CPA08g00338 [Acorus calamus]|uniref:Uncharacterized protein n=1 Tax=Acorus calamus TaxID=4465 RepID=A0AAV9E8G0_ACOCL|nr:hypothetical protein QJS10_CPA08g00338 [Acorus calamus]
MALNPQLYGNGMPVAFVGEMFVLARDGVEFEVDKIPGLAPYHQEPFIAIACLDIIPHYVWCFSQLYIRDEKFNQPIFFCNNLSGLVELVVPEDQPRALYSTHSFKILFKEGGCGTFIPLFLNLIASVRQYIQHFARSAPALDFAPHVDPLQAVQTPVEDMTRQADPTKIFLRQPTSESQLRRRAYHSQAAEN